MKKVLTQSELNRLTQVVGEVERSTSGELRLMIVGRSTPIGHVFPLATFALMSLSLVALWSMRYEMVLDFKWYLAPMILACSVLAGWLLARLTFVQRWLTSDEDMTSEVWRRAEIEFHHEGLDGTTGATGVLIFVSLMEHQAVVLADKAIAVKLPREVWSDVVQLVIEGARTGKWASKLEEAVRLCGKLLNAHFPIKAGDKNELPNHVIVKP